MFRYRCDASGRMNILQDSLGQIFEDRGANEWSKKDSGPIKIRKLASTASTAWQIIQPEDSAPTSPVTDPKRYLIEVNSTKYVQLLYPFDAPTAFILGNYRDQKLPEAAKIINGIQSALEAGVDPYFALADGLHEGGTNTLDTFTYNFHDSDLMTAMGCSRSTPSPQGPVETIVPQANLLEKKLKSDRSNVILDGNMFFCAGRGARAPGNIGEYTLIADCHDKNDLECMAQLKKRKAPYACCTKIPFSLDTAIYRQSTYQNTATECALKGDFTHIPCELIRNFLNYQSLANIVIHPSPQSLKHPEFGAQSILGFSSSTGRLLPRQVANWRLGHNSNISPVYGLTIMDFYFHSLASNPWVRSMVETLENQTQIKPAQLACVGRSPGEIVEIPFDAGINQIANARRFESLYKKWKNNIALDAADDDQLLVELQYLPEAAEILTRPAKERLQWYMTHAYSKRNTIRGASSSSNPNYTWEPFTLERAKKVRSDALEFRKIKAPHPAGTGS